MSVKELEALLIKNEEGSEEHSFNSIIETSIKNINEDREKAKELLAALMELVAKEQTKWTHKNVGEIAAKYLETLQRSNEQLVKVASLMKVKAPQEKDELSKKEKMALFDQIKGE